MRVEATLNCAQKYEGIEQMKQTYMGDPGNSPRADKLVYVITEFFDEWGKRSSREIKRVVQNDVRLEGEQVGQEPERFVVEHLIRPVMEEVFGHEYRPQPKGIAGLEDQTPDFRLMNVDDVVVGEVKRFHDIQDASGQSFGYLTDVETTPVFGISTDGMTWISHIVREDEHPSRIWHDDLRRVFYRIAIEKRNEDSIRRNRRELRKLTDKFVGRYTRSSIQSIATDATG